MRSSILLWMCFGACASSGGRGTQPPGPPTSDLGGAPVDNGLTAAVYANSDSELYLVDPDTLKVTLVGPFAWPNGYDQMTDIAIDKNGLMIGVSFDKVYSVDKTTAECTFLANLDRQFNGLSFVPAQAADATSDDELVASALDGSLYLLDRMSGASTPIGNFGGGMTSSGDVVSVSGFGTVATVKRGGASDWLATVDTQSGIAHAVGDTGVSDIWGLGFWKDKIFGFTSNNQFVLIDPKSGGAQVVSTSNVSWWGAGVTTLAPVVK
jgi:hypothetical protein